MSRRLTLAICSLLITLVAPLSASAVGSFGLTAPPNGGKAPVTPTFTWSAASQATSYTLTIVPSAGTPWSKTGVAATSYSLTSAEALSEGGSPYSWHVTAYDAGGGSLDSSTWSFFVDATAPGDFAIISPEPNAWSRTARAYVEWAPPADSSGISKYRVYVDGILCNEVAGTQTSASLFPSSCTPGEGPHVWAVAAVDTAGNVKWCSDAPGGQGGRAFRLDDTGPSNGTNGGVFQIASRDQPDNGMFDTGLNFSVGDEIKVSATGTWCMLNCQSGCDSPAGFSSASGGVPANYCYHNSLIGSIEAVNPYVCIGSNRTFEADLEGKLYLGDNIGSTGCSDRTVTATVSGGRTFNLVAPIDGASLSYPWPTFSWEAATDAGAGGVTYQLVIDGGAVGTLMTDTTTTVTTPLAEGKHTFHVTARDAVGNRTETAERTFTVDTTRPASFILDTPERDACVTLPTPNFCWHSALDSTGYQLWIDDVPAATTSSSCTTPTVAIPQGDHTWYATTVDRAGNVRRSSDTRAVRVDYTAPAAAGLLAPANGSTTADPPVFSWAAAVDNLGIDHYEVHIDGALRGTVKTGLSWLLGSDLSVGPHTWYVRAYDRCGQSAESETWTFSMAACVPDGTPHPCPGYGVGKCSPGTRTCTGPGTWSTCSGAVAPSLEICNGEDDDCDGIVDNGSNACGGVCNLSHRLYDPCDGDDADQCAEGLWVCTDRNSMACAETTPPNVEICNNRDDDCNGVVDDGCVTSLPDAGPPPGRDAAVSADTGSADVPFVAGDVSADRGFADVRRDAWLYADASVDGAGLAWDGGIVPSPDAMLARDLAVEGPATSLVDGAVLPDAIVRPDGGSDGRIVAVDAGSPVVDAGRDGGKQSASSTGCSCQVGAPSTPGSGLLSLGLLACLSLLLHRRRSHR